MLISHERYTYRVIWSEEDKKYVGLCMELPSLSWLAPSFDEATDGIHKLVADVLEDMANTKEEPPEPLAPCRP